MTSTPPADDVLLAEQRGAIGVLTINRPEKRNSLTLEILFRLHETLQTWAEAGDVRAVVITGAGDQAFSSGYDIRAIPTHPTPEMERLREQNPLEAAFGSVRSFPYPVIAMINGHCFGAGLHLAMCCDLRIGSDDLSAGMPPARLGLVYSAEGVQQFVRIVGAARARELFFTGRTYTGPDVLAMGLVDHLVPRPELERDVLALAEEIAGNAPLAVRGLKRVFARLEESAPLPADAKREVDELVLGSFLSDDAKEAQRAFKEKRPPRFTGR